MSHGDLIILIAMLSACFGLLWQWAEGYFRD